MVGLGWQISVLLAQLTIKDVGSNVQSQIAPFLNLTQTWEQEDTVRSPIKTV